MHTIAARCAASATQSRSGDPSHMCDSLLIKQSHMCDRNSITHVCDIGSHMCDACVMHHTRQRRVTHCDTHVVRCHSALDRLEGCYHFGPPASHSCSIALPPWERSARTHAQLQHHRPSPSSSICTRSALPLTLRTRALACIGA